MATHDQIRDELIRVLEAKEFTGAGIARFLGIAPARVAEMRKRERRVQQHEMERLAELFGLDMPKEDDGNVVWVPVIGIAAAGAWREAVELPQFLVPQAKVKGINQAFAVIVDGDSMNQILPERCYAIIDPDQKRLIERKVYLIQNSSGETTIKRYRENPARFEPASHNPEHEPIYVGEEGVQVIGRVVGFHSDDGF